MNRQVPFAPEEFFHLYNRGTNKMPIFLDKNDRERFLKLLYISNCSNLGKYSDIEISPGRTWTMIGEEQLVNIGAYCLMPNHFHILIKVKNEKDTSIYLQKLLTSYSMYFNKKYGRSGTLFEGKTKSKHVTEDRNLKYLFSYIHLNPVKLIDSRWREDGPKDLTKIQKYLSEYGYSSYLDYAGISRPEKIIINKDPFPEYFKTSTEHVNELLGWLKFYEE